MPDGRYAWPGIIVNDAVNEAPVFYDGFLYLYINTGRWLAYYGFTIVKCFAGKRKFRIYYSKVIAPYPR